MLIISNKDIIKLIKILFKINKYQQIKTQTDNSHKLIQKKGG